MKINYQFLKGNEDVQKINYNKFGKVQFNIQKKNKNKILKGDADVQQQQKINFN